MRDRLMALVMVLSPGFSSTRSAAPHAASVAPSTAIPTLATLRYYGIISRVIIFAMTTLQAHDNVV